MRVFVLLFAFTVACSKTSTPTPTMAAAAASESTPTATPSTETVGDNWMFSVVRSSNLCTLQQFGVHYSWRCGPTLDWNVLDATVDDGPEEFNRQRKALDWPTLAASTPAATGDEPTTNLEYTLRGETTRIVFRPEQASPELRAVVLSFDKLMAEQQSRPPIPVSK